MFIFPNNSHGSDGFITLSNYTTNPKYIVFGIIYFTFSSVKFNLGPTLL